MLNIMKENSISRYFGDGWIIKGIDMVRLYLYFTKQKESSIHFWDWYKTSTYLFFFWITFLIIFFELDGKTTSCWSSLSHPTFFTSGMFMAEEMLLCPSWHCSFSSIRVFIVNMCTSVMHPPVAFMFAGSKRFTLAGLSCSPYPKRVTFLVFQWFPSNNTYTAHIFWTDNILLFFFLLSFFWGFMHYVSS